MRRVTAENRAVATARHDPERRRGDAAIALRRREVQQRLRAHAHPDRLHAREAEVIEERGDVARALAERELLRWIRRPPVAAQIGHDDLVAVGVGWKDVASVGADAGAAMKEEQRLALAAHLEVHREAVDVYVRHDAQPTARAPLAPSACYAGRRIPEMTVKR